MCCRSSAAARIPRPALIFDGFGVLTLSSYSLCAYSGPPHLPGWRREALLNVLRHFFFPALISLCCTVMLHPILLPFQHRHPPPSVCSAWATSTSLRRPHWASSALRAWPKWSWEWPAGESPTVTLSPSPTRAWCWRCSRTDSGSRYGSLLYSAPHTSIHFNTTLLTKHLLKSSMQFYDCGVFSINWTWHFWNDSRRQRCSLTSLSIIFGAELNCQLDQRAMAPMFALQVPPPTILWNYPSVSLDSCLTKWLCSIKVLRRCAQLWLWQKPSQT